MTDNDLILKGCAAEWNATIYKLCRRFQDNNNYAANIRDKNEADKLIIFLKLSADSLEEVLTRYHELCPPPHPQSPTAG